MSVTAITKVFQPKSPLVNAATITTGKGSLDADYRLDLTLQNLLQLGLEYSPEDIIALRKRARWGDFRWLASLYDEMMRLGPSSQVLKAKEALKGTQSLWTATPESADEDTENTDPEDKTARLIRDVTEEAWRNFLPDLKTHLSTKFFYGIAAVQVMWKPKAIENRWSRVTDIRPIPARRFRLDQQTLRFVFLNNPFSWEGPYVDELQATGKMIFAEVGADTEPLDQRGLMFQCLIPWAIQQVTVRWRAKRLQNFAMPPVMVTYPDGDPANKAVADQLAELLANGTRAVMTTDMKAELLSAPGVGSRGGDPYESNIEWVERCYDQKILGHSQVSGVQQGAGSRSSSKDAISLFKDVTNSRAQELDNDLYLQAYMPYVSREFGQEWAENHTPKTESALLDRDDPTEVSTVALNLVNAGAGPVMAVESAVQRCGFDVAEDGEMTFAGTIKGQEPAAAPAVPGQGAGSGSSSDPAKPMGGAKAVSAPGGDTSGEAATGDANFASMGDVQAPGRFLLRKRKAKKAIQEFYSRRQRFAAAALIGGRPRVNVTSFGYEHGEPLGCAMKVDVRNLTGAKEYPAARTGRDHEVAAAIEAHPMTHAIYGGVKAQVLRAIKAGTVTGDTDMNIGIGCDHGKHRAVYVAERLGRELRMAGHDVVVSHRDADTASGERGVDPKVLPFPVATNAAGAKGGMRFTSLEVVKGTVTGGRHSPAVADLEARIAARVHARLKAWHARALDEVEHKKLAKAE